MTSIKAGLDNSREWVSSHRSLCFHIAWIPPNIPLLSCVQFSGDLRDPPTRPAPPVVLSLSQAASVAMARKGRPQGPAFLDQTTLCSLIIQQIWKLAWSGVCRCRQLTLLVFNVCVSYMNTNRISTGPTYVVRTFHPQQPTPSSHHLCWVFL